jgi:hypothetical protein
MRVPLLAGEVQAYFATGQPFTVWADAIVDDEAIRGEGLLGGGVILTQEPTPSRAGAPIPFSAHRSFDATTGLSPMAFLRKMRVERMARLLATTTCRSRSAFLLSNDPAMLLLRPHVSQVIGVDPLARTGLVRWSAEVFDVYSGGVFTPAPTQAEDMPLKGDRGEGGR